MQDDLDFSTRVASWAVGALAPWVASQPEQVLHFRLLRQQRMLRLRPFLLLAEAAAVGLRIYNKYPTLQHVGAPPLRYAG